MWENESLRLLVTVAETGSFTRAAARLNYTQSAVSRRIAALEHRAGGPLLVRLPRGVRLTPAGRVLHRHAVDVLDRLARAERDLTVLHAGDGGPLHTGAFATANIALLLYRAVCPQGSPAGDRRGGRREPDRHVDAAGSRTERWTSPS